MIQEKDKVQNAGNFIVLDRQAKITPTSKKFLCVYNLAQVCGWNVFKEEEASGRESLLHVSV